MKKIAVIGAGITGLSTAYLLQENGFDVTVFEKQDRPGGLIHSVKKDGWLAETGPHSLSGSAYALMNLIEQLDLLDEVVFAGRDASKRFIVKDGHPLPIPSGLNDFFKTPLLTGRAKFRLLAEPFIKAGTSDDESLASFTRRRLGPEILDYAVNPFIAGIYAGDPEQLSVKSAFPRLYELEQESGSLVKGLISRRKKKDDAPSKKPKKRRGIFSFRDGIGRLPQRLAEKLGDRLKYNAEVIGIKHSGKNWIVAIKTGKEVAGEEFQQIVSTIPAYVLTGLLQDEKWSDLRSAFDRVYYPPVSVLTLGFKREDVEHPLDGFGMLVPARESHAMLGTLFTSTLFPGRAPDGHVTLASFIGGSRQPELAILPTGELQEKVMTSLRELLGVTGDPVFSHHILRKHAIPQYNKGYEAIRNTMNEFEKKSPGLHLAGNYREGISVGQCAAYARKICDMIIETGN